MGSLLCCEEELFYSMRNFYKAVFGRWYQPCKAFQWPIVLFFFYTQSCHYPFCSSWNDYCNSGWRQFIVVLYYAVMSSYYITILILCTFLWQIKCNAIISMIILSITNHIYCSLIITVCKIDNCDLWCHRSFCRAISVLTYLWTCVVYN